MIFFFTDNFITFKGQIIAGVHHLYSVHFFLWI